MRIRVLLAEGQLCVAAIRAALVSVVFWTGLPIAGAQEDWQHTIRARGAMSYFDYDTDAQLGGLYGLDLVFPMAGQFSTYTSVTHNHFDLGSQFLGSAGAFRQGAPGERFIDGVSGGVFFDQYTDTRFDKLYLSQFRFFTGFALSEQMAFGATYTLPSDDSDSAVIALPTGSVIATFRNAEIVEAYAAVRFGPTTVTATVGQRQDPNDLVAAFHVARQLNKQTSLYSTTTYGDASIITATVGLQWLFGPGTRRVGGGYLAHRDTPGEVVRGQSGSDLPNPFVDPSLGHNLNLDAQRFGSWVTNDSGGAPTVAVVNNNNTNDDEPLGHDEFIIPDFSSDELAPGTGSSELLPTSSPGLREADLPHDVALIPSPLLPAPVVPIDVIDQAPIP